MVWKFSCSGRSPGYREEGNLKMFGSFSEVNWYFFSSRGSKPVPEFNIWNFAHLKKRSFLGGPGGRRGAVCEVWWAMATRAERGSVCEERLRNQNSRRGESKGMNIWGKCSRTEDFINSLVTWIYSFQKHNFSVKFALTISISKMVWELFPFYFCKMSLLNISD